MNFLETIYYSQYYELKKTGRDPQKGRINGTLLCATIIILLIASAGMVLFKTSPTSRLVHFLENRFDGYTGSGKALGELIGAILIVTIGGLLHNTIGSKRSYKNIAEKYMQLPEEIQAKTIKKSLYIFLVSFALFLILILIP